MRAANSDLGERTFETLRLKFSKGWSAVVSDVNASVLKNFAWILEAQLWPPLVPRSFPRRRAPPPPRLRRRPDLPRTAYREKRVGVSTKTGEAEAIRGWALLGYRERGIEGQRTIKT